jgi:hypothetical protein
VALVRVGVQGRKASERRIRNTSAQKVSPSSRTKTSRNRARASRLSSDAFRLDCKADDDAITIVHPPGRLRPRKAVLRMDGGLSALGFPQQRMFEVAWQQRPPAPRRAARTVPCVRTLCRRSGLHRPRRTLGTSSVTPRRYGRAHPSAVVSAIGAERYLFQARCGEEIRENG